MEEEIKFLVKNNIFQERLSIVGNVKHAILYKRRDLMLLTVFFMYFTQQLQQSCGIVTNNETY